MTDRSEKLAALHADLADGVANLASSAEWRAMLDTAAKFYRYSANNVMLIQLQRPDASRVAGYRVWQSLGRQVRKGEAGIKILAPCTYRTRTDDDDADAKPTGPRRVRGFRVAHVWDVSQTDGDPLPDVGARPLEGDAPADVWDAVAGNLTADGWTVERGDTAPASGWTRPADKLIRIAEADADLEALSTLVHEYAHAHLHPDTAEYVAHRGRAEVEAESVAYVVLRALGVAEAGQASFAYVAGWASKAEPKVLAATAQRVIVTARALLDVVMPEETADAPTAKRETAEVA